MIANLIMDISGSADPAESLIEGDQWNENGYFENKEFVILNNSILVGEFSVSSLFLRYPPEKRNRLVRLAMSSSHLNYFFLMLVPGLIQRRARQRQNEMAFLVQQFKGSIIKDPRFTLLIHEWSQTGAVEKVLFCFRNPYEVARSLRRRNLVPMFLGYHLWDFHTRQFLKHAHQVPVIYVNHANFFHPEQQMAEIRRLYWFLDKEFSESEARAIAGRIIRTGLRHHAFRGEKLPERVRHLNDQIASLHAEGRPPD